MEGSPVENPPSTPQQELEQILADLNQSSQDSTLFPGQHHPALFGHSVMSPQIENGYQPNFASEPLPQAAYDKSAYDTASGSSSDYNTPSPMSSPFMPKHVGSPITLQKFQQNNTASCNVLQTGTESYLAGPNLNMQIQPTMPFLVIIEQPAERCRFRYRAEQGPHGSLRSACGQKYKSCPKVKFENVHGNFGRLTVIARLFTNEDCPRPHVNDLWGNHCKDGRCAIDVDSNFLASFPNLGIMRQKEKDVGEILMEKYLEEYQNLNQSVSEDLRESLREKAAKEQVTMKDCLHSVRIGFQGFLTDLNSGQQIATPMVLSDPICNSQNPGFSELRIAEIDKSNGSVLGGDSIWMRCAAKVRRDQIKIRFHEPSTGWEADGSFSVNEVYEQILIIFKTPAYRDTNIRERVHVNLHLYRGSDGEYSPPIDFVYLPIDDGPAAKRPRLIPTLGSESFGFMYDPAYNQQFGGGQGSSSGDYGSQGGNSFEYNAYTPRQNRAGRTQRTTEQVQTQTQFLEEFSLADLKSISAQPDPTRKLEKILTQLWETHLQALWLFSSEGDPQALVAACRQLIGWQDEDGTTALHIAVRNQQPFALKTLLNVLEHVPQKPTILNSRNYRLQTPLHQAIRFSDADCVHYLITSGAERSLIDSDGNSAAHYLSDTFNEAIYKDVLFPPKDTVAAKQQLDLGHLNNAGQCPVHMAVARLKMVLLENLIEAHAPLNVQERNSGKTVLHIAAEAGDNDVVDLLLQNSVDVNIQATDGSTPLHCAMKIKHEPIIVKLIQAGADPELRSAQWRLEEDSEGMDESEELRGAGSQLQSARDLADGNDRLMKLLNGEVLDQLLEPITRLTVAASPPRPSSVEDDGDGLESMAVGGSRPSPLDISSDPMGIDRQRSPELPTAAMQDDLGSLDFIARLRLSKILDQGGRWQSLAKTLGCEHMIDLIEVVCASSEDSSSPTIVFLDQYEQVEGATVSSLLATLERLKEGEAVQLIMQRQAHVHPVAPNEHSTGNLEEMDAE